MKDKDTKKEITIRDQAYNLDSVFSDYATQNIICTCYPDDEASEGIRIALNWDHYWIYVKVRELDLANIPLTRLDQDVEYEEISINLSQEQYFRDHLDTEIKEHVFAYFTDPIETPLYCTI